MGGGGLVIGRKTNTLHHKKEQDRKIAGGESNNTQRPVHACAGGAAEQSEGRSCLKTYEARCGGGMLDSINMCVMIRDERKGGPKKVGLII